MKHPSDLLFLGPDVPDAKWDADLAASAGASGRGKAAVIAMHFVPGALGWLAIFKGRERIMKATGMESHDTQLAIITVLGIGWEIGVPFAVLRFKDKRDLRDSLRYLGLDRVDRGGLLRLPLGMIALKCISRPYMKHVGDGLAERLQDLPGFKVEDWHIQRVGYYSFPPGRLALALVANFMGEEIYFRGFLLKRLAFLGRFAPVTSNVLFLSYHLWQPSVVWPYIPLAPVVPYGETMKRRKSLWNTIGQHLVVNLWD